MGYFRYWPDWTFSALRYVCRIFIWTYWVSFAGLGNAIWYLSVSVNLSRGRKSFHVPVGDYRGLSQVCVVIIRLSQFDKSFDKLFIQAFLASLRPGCFLWDNSGIYSETLRLQSYTMLIVEMFCILAVASLSMLVVKGEMLESGLKSSQQNMCTLLLVFDSSIPLGNLKSDRK